MPLHVVHTNCRHVPAHRQAPPDGSANQQRADEARPGCVGDTANLRIPDTRLLKDLTYQRQCFPNVVARRQLRDHTTIFRMDANLAVERIRQQAPVSVVQRHAGLITGSFDAKNYHDWPVEGRFMRPAIMPKKPRNPNSQ